MLKYLEIISGSCVYWNFTSLAPCNFLASQFTNQTGLTAQNQSLRLNTLIAKEYNCIFLFYFLS